MPKQRKYPTRQCTGCLETRTKRDMVRVVRTPEGQVVLDPTGKRSGRGAYICPNVKCLAEALKSGRLARSLSVSLDPQTCQQLEQACTEWRAAGQPRR
ncbi:MAG: YlxR family protein [Bacillota bacterium]|nr:YlxR family protein [Bacillota bacterium]